MTSHDLSYFITCYPLLLYALHVYCSSHVVVTLLISSLSSGLCPTISSERPSLASQYKDYPPTPRTLQLFYFFITLSSPTLFLVAISLFTHVNVCCIKSWLTMPEQESPFENSRRLANTPPLLFRWDSNYPTTFLAKMLLPNLCGNHSTSCYFQNICP